MMATIMMEDKSYVPYGQYFSLVAYPEGNVDVDLKIRLYDDGKFGTIVDCDVQRQLCKFLDDISDVVAVFYHGVGENNQCNHFPGPHYHIVVKFDTKLQHQRKYMDLKTFMKSHGWGLTSQVVTNVVNYLRYLLQEPREFVSAKPAGLKKWIMEQPVKKELTRAIPLKRRHIEDDEGPEMKSEKLTLNKSGIILEDLVDIFRKYHRKSIVSCLALTRENGDHESYSKLFNILAGSNCAQLEKKAASLVSLSDPRKFYDIFMEGTSEENIKINSETVYASTKETHELFTKWGEEYQYALKSPTYFLVSMYAVAKQRIPKQNTFLMIGAASCGKTFWTDPLLWQSNYVGRTTNDSHFCFADLTTSKVALMNELRFNRETIEIWKGLGEGKETPVPIKNLNFGNVPSQPLVMTVNIEPWAGCSEARAPVLERSFEFRLNTPSKVLKAHKKSRESCAANPMWLRHCFTIIENNLKGLNLTEFMHQDPNSDPNWLLLEQELELNVRPVVEIEVSEQDF